MILSKLFSKKRETKMSMTEVLLSNSNNGNDQGLTEKAGAGRDRNDKHTAGNKERTDKRIINPAKGNAR